MNALARTLIELHGREGLRAEQWFDLLIDYVVAGFGLRLTEIPPEAVRSVLVELSGQYAREVIAAPWADVLGAVHMDLVSRYQQRGSGQFFTPFELCRFMARLTLGDLAIDPAAGRLVRLCEPAAGAGGMLLAALEHIAETQGPDALAWVSVTGIDIDRRCARMWPCQVLSNL